MLTCDYIAKLKCYIGSDVKIVNRENEVVIDLDVESKCWLRKSGQQSILYMSERGSETEERVYDSKQEMERNFALWLKNIFSEDIKYPYSKEFSEVFTIEEVKTLMNKYADSEFYSIDVLKKQKVNLKKNKDGYYEIFFLDKYDRKYILEENSEIPFVFKRFYNEVVYFQKTLEQLREYEQIFSDKLENDEIIQLLGYY